jgi:hypothetical protein
MLATSDLLEEIKAAAGSLGIAPATLCQRAVKNGKLVQRLEDGGDVTIGTITRLRSYIEAQKQGAP